MPKSKNKYKSPVSSTVDIVDNASNKSKEIVLSEEQSEIFNQLKDFCKNSERNQILVSGSAGTGKSTLITKFIEWFSGAKMFMSVVVTAPTHKAVKVLKKMSLTNQAARSVEFATLHSILGLRPVVDDDGCQVFKKDPYFQSRFVEFDLIIIDEASMIDDAMFAEIMKQNVNNSKIIFVGDSEQIPPINQVIAIPFDDAKREQYGIEKFSLTKIIRQSAENPIIKVTKTIRDGEFTSIDKKEFIKEDMDGHGVYFIEDTATIKSKLKEYFTGKQFEEDCDYCKVVAWRNVTVNTFNTIIRKFLFGNDVKNIIVGEKLIADKAIEISKGKIINTNEDMTVRRLTETYKNIEGKNIRYYDAIVSCDSGMETIKLLLQEDEEKFKNICDKLANDAKNLPTGSERSRAWKKFYKIKETFAHVKYNYAITAHRAQGSTYLNTFVVASDIWSSGNEEERRKILYTACSRPRNKLFII